VAMMCIVLMTYVPLLVRDILDVRENDDAMAMNVDGQEFWGDSKRAVLDIPYIS
jgi:hypothetical protein